MAASFLTLPYELKAAIFDEIADQNALFNLLRCSRLCYQVTRPFLYRNIKLSHFMYQHPKLRNSRKEHHFFPGAYRLTCSILRDPRLASFVRTFTIVEGRKPIGNSDMILTINEIDRHLQMAVRQICRFFRNEEPWLKAIAASPDSEATLAVLLPSLPCLVRLNMGFSNKTPYCNRMLRDMGQGSLYSKTKFRLLWIDKKTPRHEKKLHKMYKRMDYPETAFQHLQKVSNGFSEWSFSYELVATFFKMTSLTSMSGRIEEVRNDPMNNNAGLVYLEELEPASSNISHISLERMETCIARDIFAMVRTCCALKSLNIEWKSDSYIYFESGSWLRLDVTLMPAAATLESLTLVYSDVRNWGSPFRRQIHDTLPSLSGFTRLKAVKLGMAFIFGTGNATKRAPVRLESFLPFTTNLSAMLPPCIETVHLVRHEEELQGPLLMNVERLVEIAESGEAFAFLRTIIMEHRCHAECFTELSRRPSERLFISREGRGRYESSREV